MRVRLSGFLSQDFDGELAPPMDLGLAPAAEYREQEVEIEDARPLQARAASQADFFARHGFALLEHESKVSDWEREQGAIYLPEIMGLVRDCLLPGRRVHFVPGVALRRGPRRRYYATRVHADGPLTAEKYALNAGAIGGPSAIDEWQRTYARDEVAGFMSIGFWRTINMRQALQHMPLAICDPNSIDLKDILPTTSTIIAPRGRTTHHLVIRHGETQAWHYYPRMTPGEGLAMKACEFWKDEPKAHPQNVFHAAFEDPIAPPDAERRESFDHRLGVWIFRD